MASSTYQQTELNILSIFYFGFRRSGDYLLYMSLPSAPIWKHVLWAIKAYDMGIFRSLLLPSPSS